MAVKLSGTVQPWRDARADWLAGWSATGGVTGKGHSIVQGSGWQATPWESVQQAAFQVHTHLTQWPGAVSRGVGELNGRPGDEGREPPDSMVRTYKHSAFAGEMLVAAELSRLGYEVLLGNVGTKRTVGVDLAAVDPETGKTTSISVKSLKKRNAFLIDPERVRSEAVYVFVVTNAAGQQPKFFVVRGATLLGDQQRVWGKWGRTYKPVHGRGISSTALTNWSNNWDAIDRSTADPG